MAISVTDQRQIFPIVKRFKGYLDNSAETVDSEDLWLTSLILTNNGNSDVYVTVTDGNGTPIPFLTLYQIPGSATARDTVIVSSKDDPVCLEGGMKIYASTGAQVYARGVYRR